MSAETKKFRIEHDSIGQKEVPAEAYYGVQTLSGSRKLLYYRSYHASGTDQQRSRLRRRRL